MTDVVLAWATLRGSDLTGTILNDACLRAAEIVKSNLTDASLLRADIERTLFEENIYRNTTWVDGSIRNE